MLYLASQSPRRRELLARLGLAFDILETDVPEVRAADESPSHYVHRVARDKAVAGWAQVAGRPGAVVLAADTEVVLDDEVFGKPRDAADAAAMLTCLAGRTHEVISAVVLTADGRTETAESRSQVTFGALDAATLAAYVAGGEAMGKAGAYGIQGAAQAFIAHLAGSHSGVMGLPLYETAALLRRFGMLDGVVLAAADGAR